MTKALDSNFKQTGHQAISSIVEAWHQNLENKLPVVVICSVLFHQVLLALFVDTE